jgi:hypothetical protein
MTFSSLQDKNSNPSAKYMKIHIIFISFIQPLPQLREDECIRSKNWANSRYDTPVSGALNI